MKSRSGLWMVVTGEIKGFAFVVDNDPRVTALLVSGVDTPSSYLTAHKAGSMKMNLHYEERLILKRTRDNGGNRMWGGIKNDKTVSTYALDPRDYICKHKVQEF
jgi:hypothetical protein